MVTSISWTVSPKGGVRKCVAVWKYDKRCVYFAVESLAVSNGDEKIKTLVEYDIHAEESQWLP